MALQTINAAFKWPGYTKNSSGPGTGTWGTLDASAEYVAWVVCAKEAMVVTHVGFRTGTVAGSPTAVISIETLDASGFPSGTAYNTDTAKVTSGTLTSDTWTLVALDASATISAGTAFAIVITYASGTSIITTRATGGLLLNGGVPYSVTNVTGSAVKSTPAGWPHLALGSSSTAFYPIDGVLPYSAVATNTFSTTNSAAQGMRFQVPFACRVVGIANCPVTSNGNFNILITDDAGAELGSSSTAFDGDVFQSATSGSYYFDTPVTLSPGVWYRAVIEAAAATATAVSTLTLPSADYRSATLGGTNHHYCTRSSGTWTDTATDKIPWIDIIIDQLDDGVSSGGVVARVIGG